ncbi:hypothetical protein [Bacteroides stercorirosoris]|nr:hypothetical protein [Bacteroides stercorirosoris]
MNTRIKRTFQIFIVICIALFAYIYVKKDCELKKSYGKMELLSSYVTYSVDMLKQVSIEGISSTVFPEKNVLIYCFSEDMCDECIYQDLAELYEIQKEIGRDRVLLLPVYRMSRTNQIVYRNKLHDFKYMSIPVDSIKFPFHRGNGLEQRFFVYTDEAGGIRSLFFPQKNKQNITRIYLSGVKRQMK